jgi:hypothetical protein
MLTDGESMVYLSFAQPASCVVCLLTLCESAKASWSLGEKVTIHPKSFEASLRGPADDPAGMKAAGGPMRSRFEPDPPRVARVGTSYPPSQPRQKSRVKIGNLTQIV